MNALESFISFCDDMIIAEEARKWNTADKIRYKFYRAGTISGPGLAIARMSDKRHLDEKLRNCTSIEKCDEAIEWIDKMRRGIQRKINGKEIQDKRSLQKSMDQFNQYREKVLEKKKQFVSM